jgi:hypothetical protein
MTRILVGLLTALSLGLGCHASAQISQPPPAGRQARDLADITPGYMTPKDFRARGDAKRRGAMIRIAAASAALEIQPTYILNVDVTCTAASGTVTITPGVLPDSANWNFNSTFQMRLPGCGTSGGTLTANLTSITAAGASQTITLNGATAGTTYSGPAMVAIGPQQSTPSGVSSAKRGTSVVGAYLSGVSFTAGSTTLTVPSGTFAAYDVTAVGAAAMQAVDISIPNATGPACDQPLVTSLVAQPTATTARLGAPPTCTVSGGTMMLHWGSAIFGPSDIGKHIELIDGGGSGVNLITTIAAVVDPVHITLAANNTTAKNVRTMTELVWGSDDTAAFVAAATAAVDAGQRHLNIPLGRAYFLATAGSGVTEKPWSLSWCGQGNVYLPKSLNKDRPVSQRCQGAPEFPWPGRTINPDVHLITSRSVPVGGTLKAAFLGDSQMNETYQGIGRTGLPTLLCEAIIRQNPNRTVQCKNFSVGGTTWAEFDPQGPDAGQGSGRPGTTPSLLPGWYSPTSDRWYLFPRAFCPHQVYMKWGFNDKVNLVWGSFLNVVNTLQGDAWKTACGYNPDLILVTEGGASQSYTGGYTGIANTQYAMVAVKSWAEACATKLANGGCIGLIDIARRRDGEVEGWSPYDLMPTRPQGYLVPPADPNDAVNLPSGAGASFTWPVPVYGYSVLINAIRQTAADVAGFWSAGGTLSFSLGNGASGTPTNTTGNTAGLALAPTGGRVVLGYSGGNYTIEVLTFDVSTTATATVSGTSLTCVAACTNMFYVNASIAIPGAGAAGGLYTGTITAVTANGKGVTLSPAVGTAFTSQPTTLRFYSVQVPAYDTGIPATCTVVSTLCDTAFVVQLKGHDFVLYRGDCFQCDPIWRGAVVKFGGPFRPTFTWSGTVSSWQTPTDVGGAPAAFDFRPSNPTPYAGVTTYTEMWGPNPSYWGRYGGGANNHPSAAETLMLERVLADAGLAVPTAGQRSASIVPATGFTHSMPVGQTALLIEPAGTLATGTINLPAALAEHQLVQITSTQIVTALTVTAPPDLTLAGAAATTIGANATLTWRRMGSKLVRVQ